MEKPLKRKKVSSYSFYFLVKDLSILLDLFCPRALKFCWKLDGCFINFNFKVSLYNLAAVH